MDLGGFLSKHIDGIMLRGVRHGIAAFATWLYGVRRMVVWRKPLRSTGEEY